MKKKLSFGTILLCVFCGVFGTVFALSALVALIVLLGGVDDDGWIPFFIFSVIIAVGCFMCIAKRNDIEKMDKEQKERNKAYRQTRRMEKQTKKEQKVLSEEIVKVVICGTGEQKKSGNTIKRSLVGDFLIGPAGAIAGAATAKTRGVTCFWLNMLMGIGT